MPELTVGRELDEAVFERVYGYGKMRPDQLPEETSGEELWLNFCATPEAASLHKGPPPCFSTEIDTAWAIAEAMQAGKVLHSLNCQPVERGEWTVVYSTKGGNSLLLAVTAPTAAEAICRAALLTLEEPAAAPSAVPRVEE